MIPAPFEYVRAGTADEVLHTLAEYGDDARSSRAGCRCSRS